MARKTIEHRMTDDEFKKFADEFKTESDRAAVILGTSLLDLLLYQLLEGYLLPCTSGKDELLEGDSPLATFSSRINLCNRLGLIDAEFSRALHLVRRIRNSFAHEVSSTSLDSGSHRDRIRELAAPFVPNWALRSMIDLYFDGTETAGSQFRAIVGIMCVRLNGAINSIRRTTTDYMYELLPPGKDDEETGGTIA